MFSDLGLSAQDYANMSDDMTPEVFANTLQRKVIKTGGFVNLRHSSAKAAFVEITMFDNNKYFTKLYFLLSPNFEACEQIRKKHIALDDEEQK